MFRHIFCFGLIAASQLLGQPVLFQCPGAAFTVAEGINNNGTVVGYYYAQGGPQHGFVYSGGTCTPLNIQGATNTAAMAINDSGTISGYYTDSASFFHGFLYTAAGATTVLDYPTTTSNTLAFDINNAGTNVLADENGTVFLHSGTTYTQVILNHTYAIGFKIGINDSQNVVVGTVGTSQNPGCFIDAYPSGTSTAFSVPGASLTYCFDINNAGSIAGTYYTSQGEFAFVRVGSTVITLQGLPGAAANGLNDKNQVVGSYATSTGQTAAFITNPAGAVPSDFNGDGVSDLVWQNDTSRQVTVWYMGGTGGAVFQGYNYLSAAGVPGWHVVAVADFNGDGVPDLVWQNDTTREVTVWYMGGTGGATFQSFHYLDAVGHPGWFVANALDLNRDGVPDLIWENDTTRQVTVWYMGGTGGAAFQSYAYISQAGQPGWSLIHNPAFP